MKDYVFYPLSLSKGMNKFGKWGKEHFGKKTGRKLPICLANLIVFFLVGVWHGPAWKFIAYGMFSGVIIAFSGLMTDEYRKWKKALHISGKERWYHVFTIVRTFLLVNISWFFDCSETVGQAVKMMKYAVTSFAGTIAFDSGRKRRSCIYTICTFDYCGRMFTSFYHRYFAGKRNEDSGNTCKAKSCSSFLYLYGSAVGNWFLWINSGSERIYLCTVLRK